MLHELLLALSGYPSPLLSIEDSPKQESLFGQLTSPSERVLIRSLARLGSLNSGIRSQASSIRASHHSAVCCAVAAAIADVHLAKFQETILDVERKILRKDALFVGAYDTVPLSTVACAFDEWPRILEWLQRVLEFIQNPDSAPAVEARSDYTTAASLIAHLRTESKTGYPDLEEAALQLVRTAELAWLRQASCWILYGRLSNFGQQDFFIQCTQGRGRGGRPVYEIRKDLIPIFVNAKAAESVLAIGRSVGYINQHDLYATLKDDQGGGESIIVAHHRQLATLESPISASAFQRSLDTIRTSLSQTALQKLLPAPKILQILRVLQEFLLLERGDFATALIAAKQDYIASKRSNQSSQVGWKGSEKAAPTGLSPGEASSVLNKTWTALSAIYNALEEETDDVLETARDVLHLSNELLPKDDEYSATLVVEPPLLPKDVEKLFQTPFLPLPTFLSITIPSPIDLFLSPSDARVYSVIHNYLLCIRTTYDHMSRLWKLTALRRSTSRAAEQAARARSTSEGQERQSGAVWDRRLRGVWATVTSVVFLTGELWTHFQGEVIASHGQSLRRGTGEPEILPRHRVDADISKGSAATDQSPKQYASLGDPESLAHAHAAGLRTLVQSLLLTDVTFPTTLHTLFVRCSHLSALVEQLAAARHVAQALSDNTAVARPNVLSEERELYNALGDAQSGVDEALNAVTKRLKDIDHDGLTLTLEANSDENESKLRGNNVQGLGVGPEGQGSLGGGSQWEGLLTRGGFEHLLTRLNLGRYEDG